MRVDSIELQMDWCDYCPPSYQPSAGGHTPTLVALLGGEKICRDCLLKLCEEMAGDEE